MEYLENNTNVKTLEQLPDLRGKQGKRHSLAFITFAVMLAVLEGNSSISSLQRYIKDKISWLKEITKIEDATPISRPHLPRLLSIIDWEVLDQLIMSHFNLHLFPENVKKEWIGIDGKVLRGCLKSGEKEAIVHAVTHDSRKEVAQTRQSGDKSSEIPVVRALLSVSGLDMRKISLNAHHCNPKTLSQITVAGGTYLVQVKNNQPNLLEQCQNLAVQQESLFFMNVMKKNRGD